MGDKGDLETRKKGVGCWEVEFTMPTGMQLKKAMLYIWIKHFL